MFSGLPDPPWQWDVEIDGESWSISLGYQDSRFPPRPSDETEQVYEYRVNAIGPGRVNVPLKFAPYWDGVRKASDGSEASLGVPPDVESYGAEAVVTKIVSRFARSIRDLDRTVDRISACGSELHIIDEGLVMKPDEDDPYQNALFRLLGVFAQLEAEMAQQRTREGIAVRRDEE